MPESNLHESTKGNGMWKLTASLPVSFKIELCDNLFDTSKIKLLEIGNTGHGARRLIVIDEKVYNLFGSRIDQYFMHHKIEYKVISLESTESMKDLDSLLKVVEAMETFHILRQSEPVIAIGGGVLLDIVGLAASVYRRGIPYIRVPTTLLALVDASIGAKTAINHLGRRNRLGTYHPPVAAYLDRSFLLSLERKEFSNGLAEILKMSLIKDARLFELLEQHGKALIENKFQKGSVPHEVICRAIQTMLEELEPNLWEKNLKRLVDFGHSFSPIIEMRAMPDLSHGEAVAIDMLFSSIISNQRGLLPTEDLERIFKTMKLLELPVFHPLFGEPDVLKEALADTSVHRNGAQNLPMLEGIGNATFFNDVTPEEIEQAAKIIKERAR